MAFVHGKDSFISVDASDISSYTDGVTHDRSVDTAETSAFGDDDKTFIAGLEDGSFSLNGHWDATAAAALAACFDGGVVAMVYGPAGNTGGNVEYTCNALITNYSETSGVADRVNWSASFQRTGALTKDTF
jgi:hypothetical protein